MALRLKIALFGFDFDEFRKVIGRTTPWNDHIFVKPQLFPDLYASVAIRPIENPDPGGSEIHGPLDFRDFGGPVFFYAGKQSRRDCRRRLAYSSQASLVVPENPSLQRLCVVFPGFNVQEDFLVFDELVRHEPVGELQSLFMTVLPDLFQQVICNFGIQLFIVHDKDSQQHRKYFCR